MWCLLWAFLAFLVCLQSTPNIAAADRAAPVLEPPTVASSAKTPPPPPILQPPSLPPPFSRNPYLQELRSTLTAIIFHEDLQHGIPILNAIVAAHLWHNFPLLRWSSLMWTNAEPLPHDFTPGAYYGAAATPACGHVIPPDECMVTGGSIYHMVVCEDNVDVHVMLFIVPMAEPVLEIPAHITELQQYWNNAEHAAFVCLQSQQAPIDITQAAECVMRETVPPPRGVVLVHPVDFNLHSLSGGVLYALLRQPGPDGQFYQAVIYLFLPSAHVLLGP